MCWLLASVVCVIDWGSIAYQLVEDAVVEGHLGLTALEEIVVVVLKAVGVGLELIEAVGVDILDTVARTISVSCPAYSLRVIESAIRFFPKTLRAKYIHASSTARHLAPLLQALDLPAAISLVLALHEIVVKCLAAVANEVRRAGQESRGGANLLHLGDVVRHGGGVHEDMLVEPVGRGIARLVLVLARRESMEGVINGRGKHTEGLAGPL
jgi:hypothetical protein